MFSEWADRVVTAPTVKVLAGIVFAVPLAPFGVVRIASVMREAPDASAVNDRVLEPVAVPVEITGDPVRRGDRLVLIADPATVQPVGS